MKRNRVRMSEAWVPRSYIGRFDWEEEDKNLPGIYEWHDLLAWPGCLSRPELGYSHCTNPEHGDKCGTTSCRIAEPGHHIWINQTPWMGI